MLHLYDRATMAHALTLDLEPRLRELLVQRFDALMTEFGDLTDYTEYLIIDDPRDTEEDIVRHLGFSPVVDPFSGAHFGEAKFEAVGWDYAANRGGWIELIFTFGSTFACQLLVRDGPGSLPLLIKACMAWSVKEPD